VISIIQFQLELRFSASSWSEQYKIKGTAKFRGFGLPPSVQKNKENKFAVIIPQNHILFQKQSYIKFKLGN
jgi:hypothetical protein